MINQQAKTGDIAIDEYGFIPDEPSDVPVLESQTSNTYSHKEAVSPAERDIAVEDYGFIPDEQPQQSQPARSENAPTTQEQPAYEENTPMHAVGRFVEKTWQNIDQICISSLITVLILAPWIWKQRKNTAQKGSPAPAIVRN